MYTEICVVKKLSYMTVDDNDILPVCPQPCIHTATQVHQLLQLWGTSVRPRKVVHLWWWY